MSNLFGEENALNWLHSKLISELVRREKMGGQTHSYFDAGEVIGWVEEAQKRSKIKIKDKYEPIDAVDQYRIWYESMCVWHQMLEKPDRNYQFAKAIEQEVLRRIGEVSVKK